jgi:ATP-binding cassette, subfamily C (CFTR/MRP), member 1
MRLGTLLLWILTSVKKTNLTRPAAAISFVAAIPLSLLSYMDHVFTVSPSLLVELYLLLTVGFDIVRIRTLWLMQDTSMPLAAIETASLMVKLVLAIVEARPKISLLQDRTKRYTGEQLSGLYGQSLLLWLCSTLWNGLLLLGPCIAA